MPPLVVVTAAAVREVPRIGGALFPQHLDRLTQFMQLVILSGNKQTVRRLMMVNNGRVFLCFNNISFEIYIFYRES